MLLEGRSFLSGKAIAVELEGGRIARVVPLAAEPGDALPWIAPGLFDLQVNGYRGLDYSAMLTRDQVRAIVTELAAAGVTQHLPTLVTAPRERILASLRALAAAVEADSLLDAALPGFHVEGPFISGEEGPRGVHPASFVRDPDWNELEEWQAAARGRIVLVTIAPERAGSLSFIERAAAAGVRVAIGHTSASPEQIRDAVAAGASLSTHLGNGCHALLPRHGNYLWEQLAADELAAGIISDGFHLPPSMVKVFSRAKPSGRLFLVSDAALHGGRPPGRYEWLDQEIEVHPDGHLTLAQGHGGQLAGAGHLLDWGLAHYLRFTGRTLAESLPLASSLPAELIGGRPRRIEPGAEANLILFDWRPGDDRLAVRRSFIAGREVA